MSFYVTTPIYYPSGEPHLGHVYTTTLADAVARYRRLRGEETFFLTGTDEHGIKMVKAAAEAGLEPRQLADRMSGVFRALWAELGISNDDFIRTPEPRHAAVVQEVVRRLVANDDIYLGAYRGWYDEGQEEFVTETAAKASGYKSPVSGRPLTRYEEPTYFLRLKKYVPRIIEHIERNPDFLQPESRRNEVLSKLRAGVEDLSISRASLTWGVPMANDPSHVVYVWIDALSNYLSALGFTSADDARFRTFWPADVHLIGKEILWFHAVYWPAMLLSLGLPLPKRVYAHGWWTADGFKMSKSLGNFIDIDVIRRMISTYGLDALRYYLIRSGPGTNDADWNEADLLKAFNELANVLGNCLNRTVKMVGRYRGGVLPSAAPEAAEDIDRNVLDLTANLPTALHEAYERLDFQKCAMLPIELARATNGYIDATAPFSLAKDPAKARRLDMVLNVSARAIGTALAALLPILPTKAAEGLAQLGVSMEDKTLEALFSAVRDGQSLGEGQPLFPKLELRP